MILPFMTVGNHLAFSSNEPKNRQKLVAVKVDTGFL
jgi:hypothetical protein